MTTNKLRTQFYPSLIVFDFDGVLTDNHVFVFEDGHEAVLCHRGDGLSFDILRRLSIPSLILSTETNPVVSARAKKLKLSVLQGTSNKLESLVRYCEGHSIALQDVMFVGNDINDIEVMRAVGCAVAVADAHPSVKAVACIITKCSGGQGVVREIVEDLIQLPKDGK